MPSGAAGIFMAVRSEADVKVRCIALHGLSLVATPDLEVPLLKVDDHGDRPDRAVPCAPRRCCQDVLELQPERPPQRIVYLLPAHAAQAHRKTAALTTLLAPGDSVGADYVARYALLEKQGGAAESAVDALGHWNDKTALAPSWASPEGALSSPPHPRDPHHDHVASPEFLGTHKGRTGRSSPGCGRSPRTECSWPGSTPWRTGLPSDGRSPPFGRLRKAVPENLGSPIR